MILKFRAWNKATKEMHEADDIVSLNFGEKQICVQTIFFGQLSYYDFDDIVSMQSTGLKDKNGKEIFEGDIITNGIEIADIKNHQTLGFYTVLDDREYFFASGMSVEDFEEYADEFSQTAKIISNIYENPELLK